MRIRKNKFDKWVATAHNKMLNGEDIFCDVAVQFQKGFEPSKDKIAIELKRWWLTCYLGKGYDQFGQEMQMPKPKIFIADWREILPEAQKTDIDKSIEEFKAKNYEPSVKELGLDISEEELPFY